MKIRILEFFGGARTVLRLVAVTCGALLFLTLFAFCYGVGGGTAVWPLLLAGVGLAVIVFGLLVVIAHAPPVPNPPARHTRESVETRR